MDVSPVMALSLYLMLILEREPWGYPWWSSGQNSVLSLSRVQVQSLVGELNPTSPVAKKKNKNKKQKKQTNKQKERERENSI